MQKFPDVILSLHEYIVAALLLRVVLLVIVLNVLKITKKCVHGVKRAKTCLKNCSTNGMIESFLRFRLASKGLFCMNYFPIINLVK